MRILDAMGPAGPFDYIDIGTALLYIGICLVIVFTGATLIVLINKKNKKKKK